MSNPLTDGQLTALRNLADKQAGAITAFVNIADARILTEMGLAARSRQGWDITEAGRDRLAQADRPARHDGAAPPDLQIVDNDDAEGD